MDCTHGDVLSYAGRRIAWTIPILFLTLTLVFFALRAIGGDPLRRGQLVGLSNVAWVKTGDPKPEAIERNARRARSARARGLINVGT